MIVRRVHGEVWTGVCICTIVSMVRGVWFLDACMGTHYMYCITGRFEAFDELLLAACLTRFGF